MSDSLKNKFHKLKDEAEKAGDSAKNYFSDLKRKASEMFKEHFPGAEQHFDDFFESTEDATGNVSSSPTTEVNPAG